MTMFEAEQHTIEEQITTYLQTPSIYQKWSSSGHGFLLMDSGEFRSPFFNWQQNLSAAKKGMLPKKRGKLLKALLHHYSIPDGFRKLKQ